MYEGKRRWEALGVPDTPKNRKMAGELRSNIVYRIKTGTFDYRSQFPDSPLFKNEVESSKPVAIREIADLWLKLKKPDWANSSYVTTERRVRVTLDHIGNSRDIRSIMQKDLLSLRIELLNGSYFTGRKMNIEKKGRTAATVNSSMSDLKAIFAFAHGNGYIEANPMTGIKPLKKSIKRPDPITREEFPRLIAGCPTRQNANMWSLAILTGLRHGEICALAWEDIDLEAKTITVSRNLTPQDLFTPPKTEAGNRVICMIDAAVEVLRDQRQLTRMYPPTPFALHTREHGERIEDQKTFVFNASLDSVNGRSGAYYSTESLGPDMERSTDACRPSSPQGISVQAHVRMLGAVGRRKPELRRRANGSLRCADGVPGLWRLDVREQYGSTFPHQHENERSYATYVLR